MANGSPHRNRFVVVFVVIVVACMWFWCLVFFWGVGVCVVGVLLFLSTSDGQLTDYYLVNHCSYSSEGATVGI